MTTRPREKDLFPTFEPGATYRYTWPGHAPRMISGAALTELCRGADPEALNIVKVETRSRLVTDAEDVPTMSLSDTDKFIKR